jgi:hypothetical protein
VNGITGREQRSQPAARPRCRLSDFRPPQLSNLSPPLTGGGEAETHRRAPAQENKNGLGKARREGGEAQAVILKTRLVSCATACAPACSLPMAVIEFVHGRVSRDAPPEYLLRDATAELMQLLLDPDRFRG